MNNITDFFEQNYLNIGIIVLVVLGLLVFINIENINLNAPIPPSHLVQSVTIETFNPTIGDTNEDIDKLNMLPAQGFCDSYQGKSDELEPACNQLTETNCAQVSCCVYNKGFDKCVAGSSDGPTYKTDKEGKMITADTYYYLGKCYGKCPTPM